MYKKSLATVVLAGCAACGSLRQPNPTPINSTLHTRPQQTTAGTHSANHNSGSKTEPHATSHGETATHEGTNHSATLTTPDAASQPFDLQFLDTMIAHHQGAIEMAKPATVKARNADLKTLAFKIVADQEREINEMKRWREQWFAGKPAALNMQMAGMADSMKGMNMTALMRLSGDEFDQAFINQMTPHHQGAVVMAREALTKAEHAELKTLANQIIQAQEAEIKQMQNWKTK